MPAQDPQGVRRTRPAPIDADVVRVESRSGGFVRVVFGGASMSAFAWPGAASHLKFLPPSDESTTTPPETDGRPISRTYTPRSFNAAGGELTIDFLIHGQGPATEWATRARPGMRAKLSLPRAAWSPSADASWLLLAGDDSAIPAISTILESGTPTNTVVVIETSSSGHDRPDVPSAGLVHWVGADADRPGNAMQTAVRDFVQPSGPGLVWVAGEAHAIRVIRRHLIEDRALSTDAIVTRGYWRQGQSNHPDHDFGADDPE